MQYAQLISYKSQIMSLFSEYGIENPRVFGSTVKGNSHQNSDVDFLVNWPTRHSLFDRIQVKKQLESLLHSKVDLVTEKSLYPSLREEVLRTARPL